MTKTEAIYNLLRLINTQDLGNDTWGMTEFYGSEGCTAREYFGNDLPDQPIPHGHYLYLYTDGIEPVILRQFKKVGGFFDGDFQILTTVSKHGSPIYLYRL